MESKYPDALVVLLGDDCVYLSKSFLQKLDSVFQGVSILTRGRRATKVANPFAYHFVKSHEQTAETIKKYHDQI
jgi:hypothetical protein